MPRRPYRRRRRRRGSYLKKQVGKNKKKLALLSRAIEYKYFDATQVNGDVNTTGASKVLNAMQQGDTASTREGNKVLARRLTIRGYLNNKHGTPADCICRIIVLRARDQNNANQTLSLVLQNFGASTNEMIYDAHKHRYQILVDKTISMDTTAHSLIPFYFTHKCKTECTYNGNAGDYTDIEDGAYYIMWYSTVAGTTDDPQITFTSRFYYLDA